MPSPIFEFVLRRAFAPCVALGCLAGHASAGVLFTVGPDGPSGLESNIFYTNLDICSGRATGTGGGSGSGLNSSNDDVDGMSKASDDDEFVMCWSVDPASEGSGALLQLLALGPGIPNFRVNDQFANNQAAGDTFVTTEAFDADGIITSAGLGLNSNRLANNQGGLYIHDFSLLPDIDPDILNTMPGSIDDVNGETQVPDPCAPPLLYFTLTNGSPSLATLPGPSSGATIIGDPDINMGGDEFLYANPLQLGLQLGDDIDALVVKSAGAPGVPFDPAFDFVLFSLAPGSPSLGPIGAGPADVFIVDDQGLRLVAQAPDYGLRPIDNIDSLDTIELLNNDVAQTLIDRVYTDPCPADVDNNGIVDLNDLSVILFNFGSTGNPRFSFGDTDGDGDVDLADLSNVLFHFGQLCLPTNPVGKSP